MFAANALSALFCSVVFVILHMHVKSVARRIGAPKATAGTM